MVYTKKRKDVCAPDQRFWTNCCWPSPACVSPVHGASASAIFQRLSLLRYELDPFRCDCCLSSPPLSELVALHFYVSPNKQKHRQFSYKWKFLSQLNEYIYKYSKTHPIKNVLWPPRSWRVQIVAPWYKKWTGKGRRIGQWSAPTGPSYLFSPSLITPRSTCSLACYTLIIHYAGDLEVKLMQPLHDQV